MSDGQKTGGSDPAEMYCLFAGMVDQVAVQRFHNGLALCSAAGVKHMHILFQCAGGIVGDGISLYNLFRASPVELTLYNVGAVCSAGVIAYLGAKNRKTSTYAAFMIHRAYISPTAATSDRLSAAADQIVIDDDRIERILKLHTKIPPDKWEIHRFADVWISAKDAVDYKIADGIGEFAPPVGQQIFNVWPPQQ